jgi:hypothetical protein
VRGVYEVGMDMMPIDIDGLIIWGLRGGTPRSSCRVFERGMRDHSVQPPALTQKSRESGGVFLTGCCPNKNSFERFIETFFAYESWRSKR